MKRLLTLLLLLPTLASAQFVNRIEYEHATDCPNNVTGEDRTMCVDLDDGKVWRCEPSAGDCDTAAEWNHLGGVVVDVIADREWAAITQDFTIGDGVDEGQIQIGNAWIGQADDTISTTVLDDILIIYNNSDSVENIAFMMVSSTDVPRFVIAEEGSDLATYNPRSLLIGPAATMANVDENILCSTTFSSIDCDTGGTGADLGVQDDVEVNGQIFVDTISEDTAAAGVTIDGVLLKDGGITAAASATPQVGFDDSDTTVETVDARIQANATDAVTAQEDVDLTFAVQVNSTLTDRIQIDADGPTSFLNSEALFPNLGIEFTESDTNPTCAAGDYGIYADLSETKLKKCENGSATDLDTTGASFPQVRSMNWSAGSWSTDGTGCADATEVAIPSGGAESWTVKCADSDTARSWHNTLMPQGWNAGTVQFFLEAYHATSESITCLYDLTCQCTGDGEAFNNTFTTESATTEISLAFTTLADQRQYAGQSGGITCTGTCAANDNLRWELEVDATGSGANCANVNLLNVRMEYTASSAD